MAIDIQIPEREAKYVARIMGLQGMITSDALDPEAWDVQLPPNAQKSS